MMRALLPLLAIGCATGAIAAPPDMVAEGRRVFEHTCAPCHGAGPGDDGAKLLPGTAALDARYHGTPPAALEQRGDLPPEVLHYVVRNGAGAMPMFRKTEISDAQIDAVAAYLAAAARTRR